MKLIRPEIYSLLGLLPNNSSFIVTLGLNFEISYISSVWVAELSVRSIFQRSGLDLDSFSEQRKTPVKFYLAGFQRTLKNV